MLFPFNFTLEYREVYPHTILEDSREGTADTIPGEDCMQVSWPGLLPSAGNAAIPVFVISEKFAPENNALKHQ